MENVNKCVDWFMNEKINSVREKVTNNKNHS